MSVSLLGRAAPAGEARSGGGGWMVTFADLLALLIAFFVLLYSMSELKQDEWQELRDAISDNPRSGPTLTQGQPAEAETLKRVLRLPGQDLDYLAKLLPPLISGEPLLAGTSLRQDPDRLVVALPDSLLFAPGAMALNREGRAATAALAQLLGNLENRIEVEGHADPRPTGAALPSNWELSLGRAAAVAALIEAAGYEGAIPARGLGDSGFGALPAELVGADRLAAARRVEIIVHADAGEGPS